MTARTGITDEGDGAEYQFGALFGSSFGDDRGHALIAAEYSRSEGIDVSSKPYGFADIGGTVATFV